MDNFYLNELVAEVSTVITGRHLTRANLSDIEHGSELRLEFGGLRYMLICRLSGNNPAIYLRSGLGSQARLARTSATADSGPSGMGQHFLLHVRSRLVGAGVAGIIKDQGDRVVRITFDANKPPGGDGEHLVLILMLTGRSVNAVLAGQSGRIEAALKEAGPIQLGHPFPPPRAVPVSWRTARETQEQDLMEEQILHSYFGRSSPFSAVHKSEFLSRARFAPPPIAFRSLVEDLVANTRKPLVYSRGPLDQAAVRVHVDRSSPLNPPGDFILSCIELTAAEGLDRYDFDSFSEAAEVYSAAVERAAALRARYSRLASALTVRVKKLTAALQSIESDLARFRESDKLKRYGDLLLANLTSARIAGGIATVKNYYEPGEPEVEIEIEPDQSLQQAAAAYYQQYQKARRAEKALRPRATEIRGKLAKTQELLALLGQNADAQRIEDIETRSGLGAGDKSRVSARAGSGPRPGVQSGARRGSGKTTRSRRGKAPETGRRFLSSDGYEIIVGRNDNENDEVTFRVAGPLDIWLHAADYPGSHVIIRNPTRRPVPQRTILEAAQVAGFYSQARSQGKAAVHYTQKKFVTKPPRAKPGLVRLSSFKTVLVSPAVPAGLDRRAQD